MTTVQELHAEYNRLTGSLLRLSMDRIYWWEHWQAQGHTIEDLRLVVAHIQHGIKEGHRHLGALKWSNLIQDEAHFEEEKSEARAEQRNRPTKPDARQQALAQLRPTVTESVSSTSHVQHVSVAAEKALENLKAWKKETFGPHAAQRESRKET